MDGLSGAESISFKRIKLLCNEKEEETGRGRGEEEKEEEKEG